MLEIQKKFIKYNFSKRNEAIKYIVIHDVGAVSTALNNYNYFNSGNRGSSADFFVDTNNIIQLIDYNKNYSWAVGDGKGKYGITNRNSISIEMCLESNMKPSEKTVQNTLELVRFLMKELNIPVERVVRHFDASRKNCPQSFSGNNWEQWHSFKNKIEVKNMVENFEKEMFEKQLYAVECSLNQILANLYTEVDTLNLNLKAVQDLRKYVENNIK